MVNVNFSANRIASIFSDILYCSYQVLEHVIELPIFFFMTHMWAIREIGYFIRLLCNTLWIVALNFFAKFCEKHLCHLPVNLFKKAGVFLRIVRVCFKKTFQWFSFEDLLENRSFFVFMKWINVGTVVYMFEIVFLRCR